MTLATDTSIQPSSRVVRSEAIIFTELDDSVVMMDVEQGRYYELDPVGARVWALAESGPRVVEVCEALVTEYEVVPEICYDEMCAFLNELRRLEAARILPGDDAKEVGNGDAEDDPRGASDQGRQELPPPRHGRAPGARRTWTQPTVRAMGIRFTESGTYPPSGETTSTAYGPFS